MEATTLAKDDLRAHKIVSKDEWIKARQALLTKEKEWTRAKDDLTRERQDLPWVRVEKAYVFEGPNGLVALTDLFRGRSQLFVYHFMFAPEWDEGCSGCSFICDHVDAARQHFEHHDVKFVAISRAPIDKLEAFKKRMGWTFDWLSSDDSDFNYDFGASFRRADLGKGPVFYNFKMQKLNGEDQPGMSVFYKDPDGAVYHTYSSYERGGDILIGAYNFLDMTPKGRNEQNGMEDWMRLHDQYGKG